MLLLIMFLVEIVIGIGLYLSYQLVAADTFSVIRHVNSWTIWNIWRFFYFGPFVYLFTILLVVQFKLIKNIKQFAIYNTLIYLMLSLVFLIHPDVSITKYKNALYFITIVSIILTPFILNLFGCLNRKYQLMFNPPTGASL